MNKNNKKKVLIFFPLLGKGGIEKNFIWFVENLKKKSITFEILCFNNESFKNKYLFNFVSFPKILKKFKEKSIFYNLFSIFYLFIFLKINKKKYQTILSYKSHLIVLIASFFFDYKIIIRLSNYFGNDKLQINKLRFIFLKIKYFFYSKANIIVSPSEELKIEIFDKFKLNTIFIPNPYIESKYTENVFSKLSLIDPNILDDKKIKILSIGRLTYQKNYALLINAINIIYSKYKIQNFCLFIIGDGDQFDKLNSLIKDYNLEKVVFLLGFKNNPLDYISKSDFYVQSSLYEGMPNSIIEAVYFKKFILSSNCKTGVKEILDEEKLGMTFKNNDLNDLVKKLSFIINNFDTFKLNKKAHEDFLKKYNPNKIFNEYLKLLTL